MVNRITQQIINRNLLNSMQAGQANLFNTQRQMSSGLRYEKPSEDPLSASVLLDLNQAISFQTRIQSNAQIAQDFNNTAENELSSAEEVLQRTRELAIRAANEALNEQQIDGMSNELSGLLEQMLDLANGTHEGRFLFGGYQTQQTPFEIEKNLTLKGSAVAELNLNTGDYRTQVETRSITTAQAGAFALNGGDLLINHIDMGTFIVNDPSRSAAENAETLVERINTFTAQTGVTARAVTVPGGTFAVPGAGPLEGIALANLDTNGKPSTEGIQVAGRGIPGVGSPLFRNEILPVGGTRFRGEQIAAGAIGDVPAGTLSINGISLNSAMTFLAGNSAEQNAQEIARAINTLTSRSQVTAKTDGYGYVQLSSQNAFEIAGAPAQIELPNQLYVQTRDGSASSGPVNTGAALTLSEGSLIVNGIDVFSQGLTLSAGLTVQERANLVVRGINARTQDTGISATRDSTGQIFFSNAAQQITGVHYRGDAGDNKTQIGLQNLVPLYMSGDEAFAGNRAESTLISAFDLPAAGLGTAFSSANVTFLAGDSLGAGDFTLNGTDILVPGPLTGAAAADAPTVIAAINAQSGVTGVNASLSGLGGIQLDSVDGSLFTLQSSGTGSRAQIPDGSYLNALGAGDFFINGVDIGPIPTVPANPTNPLQNARDLGQTLVDAINAQAGTTGVRAELQVDFTGAVRMKLLAPGQDIEITSSNPVPATLLNATGLSDGTKINQRIDVFDTIISLRDQVINSQYYRSPILTISNQNIKEVSDALDVLVGNRVQLGVRAQRAEMVQLRSERNREILVQQRSENQDTDLTEAISRLTQEETSLQAAYAVTQRVNNLSLLNYI